MVNPVLYALRSPATTMKPFHHRPRKEAETTQSNSRSGETDLPPHHPAIADAFNICSSAASSSVTLRCLCEELKDACMSQGQDLQLNRALGKTLKRTHLLKPPERIDPTHITFSKAIKNRSSPRSGRANNRERIMVKTKQVPVHTQTYHPFNNSLILLVL